MKLFLITQRYFSRDSDQLGEIMTLGAVIARDEGSALAAVPAAVVLDEDGWQARAPVAREWGEFDPSSETPTFLGPPRG